MKKVVLFSGIVAIFFLACNSNKQKLEGTWKEVLSAAKKAQVDEAFKINSSEIDKLTSVSEGLADEYNTDNLDTLKARMRADLAAEYAPQESASNYRFSKDGFLIIENEKNGRQDTLYTYTVDGTDLNTSLIKESPLDAATLFEDGGSYQLVKVSQDTLAIAITGGTFVDTTYLQKVKN